MMLPNLSRSASFQRTKGYTSADKQQEQRRRRRQPFQELRMNPFSQNVNNVNDNYPGLDRAFEKQSNHRHHDQDFSHSPISPDRASSSIVSLQGTSDELNMSIGARAAINEHTRHIARFGLDGSMENRRSPSPLTSTPSPSAAAAAAAAAMYNTNNSNNVNNSTAIKDAEWDRLMDGTSISNASFSSTFILENSRSQMLSVTCDQSSDFFNSSRVAMLATPEKNKAKVDEASRLARTGGVNLSSDRRGGVGIGGGSGGIHHSHYSESISGSTDQSGMIGLFNAALRFGECIEENNNDESIVQKNHDESNNDHEGEEESFISYHEPNLSLISNKDKDTITASIFENNMGISPEVKAPSDIFPSEQYQESSFISYHEPDLSIISNQHETEISIIGNQEEAEISIIRNHHTKSGGKSYTLSPNHGRVKDQLGHERLSQGTA